MKTRILYFALAAAALLSLGACNDMKEQGLSGERIPLKFSASVGAYATKATDNAFEVGDEVGLFATAPLSLTNEKLTWNGAGLAAAQPLYWPADTSAQVGFRAYYPYHEELTALEGNLPFKVKKDQTEYKDYTASDLMFATATATPNDGTVNLLFDHKLSKIAVNVVNNTGDPIRNVTLAVLYGTAMVDASNGEVTGAEMEKDDDIDATLIYPYVSGNSFYAIVPPQKTPVAFILSTAGGNTYYFYCEETELLAGKQSRGTVTINPVPEGEKVEFNLSIVPWEEGGNIRFTDNETGTRSGYDVYLIDTRERLPMTETAPGEFFFNFPDYKGEAFYVLNENFNYIYGCTLQIPQDLGTWPCVNGGYFQLSGYEGDLNVLFYPDEGKLTYEPVYPEWKSIGEGEVVCGMFSNYYGYIPDIVRVKVYEDTAHPGMYMLWNPFENASNQNAFILSEYREFIIDARNPEKVFLKPVEFYSGYSWFRLYSDVAENGGDVQYGDYGYGTLKDGVIRLGYLTADYSDGEIIFNTDNAFQLVLPGYKREPVLGFGYSFNGTYEDGDSVVAEFLLKPYPDMQRISYMFFSGKPSSQEINGDILPEFKAGGGEPVPGLVMGEEFLFSVPVTQSGRYTGFFYGDAPDYGDDYWYWYSYFVVEVPGSEFPAAGISLSDAAASSLFPDKAATVHVDFPYASSFRLRAVSKDAAQEAGLTEDDYYSYAMAGGFAPGFMSFVSDNSGADLGITGLQPETDYLLIAAGYDFNGNSSWTSTTVRTSAEPSWSDFGEGTWTDDSWLTGSYSLYSSPVTIQKASDTGRYRALKPYASYWENTWPEQCENDPDNFEGTYAGYSDDFEFAFVEDGGESYIYYLPFRPGYVLRNFAVEGTDTGVIAFTHHNIAEKRPSAYAYISQNKALSEGVYNIAPYGDILNSGRYYNWMYAYEAWVLSMPGHSFTPEQAPAMKRQKAEQAPFAPVSGEHKVLPFKRQPVKLGRPTVTPVNNND